ncbi:MAG TPA: S8 family serine peptidase, partial [Phycisphaerales bacterium]|nr:S8 family serine peptidase [Phycisphaerales bacterium]
MRGHISRSLSLTLAAGLALCGAAAHGQVWLRSTPDRFTTIGDANASVAMQLTTLRGEFDRRIALQLAVRADDSTRELLAADGIELLAPLGNDAFFAVLRADADVAALDQSKMIAGASAIDPAWKIDRKLLGNIHQLYNVTDPALTREADPIVPVLVMLHADQKADAMAVPRLLPHAEAVRGALESIPVFMAEVRQSKIAALAQEDIVQWIAPALPELGELNAENRTLTQAALLQTAPYNLNGAGVSVLVFDSGWVRTTHQDFQGRATVIDPDTDTISSHSTHCAGTVGGGGVANATHRGMAPGVQILSAGLGTLGTGWLYTNAVDIESNYTAAITAGADIATNSIGTNVANNGFSCTWYGDYNVTDILIDNIVRGALPATQQKPFRVTWAAGNERSSTRCSTGYASTAPPSNNKNAMVIGAIDSVSQAMTSFSSWGPTEDGRMRPDFSTGGCQSSGDAGVTSTSSTNDTSYSSLCGTSMATPTVAGISALILQDFRAQFPEIVDDPRNSFLKALLAQTAVDLGTPGPDYQFGYGSIRAKDAIDLMRTGQFLEASLSQGGLETRIITVPAGASELVVTIAWDDAPGTPNVVPSLVNDIDMEITGPTGTTYRPWSLDPASPSSPAVTTAANRRDNIEQIRIANPAAGAYELDLIAFNVPAGSQAVSVVSSHPIAGGSGTPRVVMNPGTLAAALVPPASQQPVSVVITTRSDELVAGSAVLKYASSAGAPYQSIAMTQNGNTWTAQLPGFACGDQPRYYFEATGSVSGIATLPFGGASSPYSFGIGGREDRFSDTLTTNQGWTVTNTPINASAATTGAWELATPQQT